MAGEVGVLNTCHPWTIRIIFHLFLKKKNQSEISSFLVCSDPQWTVTSRENLMSPGIFKLFLLHYLEEKNLIVQDPWAPGLYWLTKYVQSCGISMHSERISILLNIMFCTHGKISFRINLLLFSTVLPSNSCCFCPVGLSLL